MFKATYMNNLPGLAGIDGIMATHLTHSVAQPTTTGGSRPVKSICSEEKGGITYNALPDYPA